MITIVVRGWPFVVVQRGSRPSARETRRVHPDGDVLPPVLHRLRAGAELTAAAWCRTPGATSRVRATVVAGRLVVEAGDSEPLWITASPVALPLRTRSVDRVAVPMLLPHLRDIDGLFAELRRVLAPHGLISVLVPAPRSFGWGGGALRKAVRDAWRHRSAVEHPEWLAAAADFAVLADDRLDFTLDGVEPSKGADELCAAGVYPPDLPERARAELAAHRSAVRTVRLRRVVARR